jgi:beta-galactosidase
LHPGENTIAIAVINSDGAGGIGNGIALKFFKKPEAPSWQRSVFNGLAQVIVQSDEQGGDINLTATADGLKAAVVSIHTQELK